MQFATIFIFIFGTTTINQIQQTYSWKFIVNAGNEQLVVRSPSDYDCFNRKDAEFNNFLDLVYNNSSVSAWTVEIEKCIQFYHSDNCSGDPDMTLEQEIAIELSISELRYNSMSGCFNSLSLKNNTKTTIETLDIKNYQLYDSRILIQEMPPIPIIAFNIIDPTYPLDADTVDFSHGKTVLFSHGYWTPNLNDGRALKDALFFGARDMKHVVLLDWRRWSLPSDNSSGAWPSSYKIVALENLPIVARTLQKFMERKFERPENLHLIGFSLGGHVSGTAARHYENKDFQKVQRISALDPAGPIFEYSLYGLYPINTTNTLRRTDANFIDVVHASTVLGMNKEAGHLDIYIDEYECYLPPCLHHRAVELYISSISNCSLITCPSNLIERVSLWNPQMNCKTKDSNLLSSLGYLAPMYNGRGRHEIILYKIQRGKESTGNCSTFMDLRVPARNRICHDQPTDQVPSCAHRPYLHSCSVNCPNGLQYVECTVPGKSLIKSSVHISSGDDNIYKKVRYEEGATCTTAPKCQIGTQQVSFFIAYKLPNSLTYLLIYQDPDTKQIRSYFKNNIDSEDSPLGMTIKSLYTRTPHNYFMWNDDHKCLTDYSKRGHISDEEVGPEENVPTLAVHGHSKGLVHFSMDGGFMLVHSLPSFPLIPEHGLEEFIYPNRGKTNAQTFLCISLEKDYIVNNLHTITDQIRLMFPKVYASKILPSTPDLIKESIKNLIRRKGFGTPRSPTRSFTPGDFFDLHVQGRSALTGNPEENREKDAFSYIAKHYETNLLAQTWKDARDPWSSTCNEDWTIENVLELSLDGERWKRTKDHSKWAISKNQGVPLVCIGDLNRASTTMARGGLFICTRNENIYNIFWNIKQEIESCPSTTNLNPTTFSFECNATTSIPFSWRCDGETDCDNANDERNCSICTKDKFICPSHITNKCIPNEWKCDGDSDCAGGEDEIGCNGKNRKIHTCTTEQYYCYSNERCIDSNWKCDGDKDCAGGEDEEDCGVSAACNSSCRNGNNEFNEDVTKCCKGLKGKPYGWCSTEHIAYCSGRI